MRDIYLVDFENVASDGLSGITYLTEEDQVIIFYSNNSKSLSMKMHILIGKSVCKLSYFEATVGGKNALDHQISTWLGYLIGTGAGDRYFIVSRDMGYKFVANFWAVNDGKPKVYCADNIRGAIRLGRSLRNQEQQNDSADQPQETPAHGIFRQETGTDIPEIETREPAPPPAAPETAGPETPAAPEAEMPPAPLQHPDIQTAPAEKDGASAETSEAPAAQTAEAPEGNGLEAAIDAEEEPKGTLRQPQRRQRKGTRRQEVSGRNGRKQEPKPDSRNAKSNPQNQNQQSQQNQQNRQSQQNQKAPQNAQPKNQPGQQGAKTEKAPVRQERPKADQLQALIAPYPALQENTLRELIQANKRQVLCNTLRKQLGQEKGLALYNEIKKSAWK